MLIPRRAGGHGLVLALAALLGAAQARIDLVTLPRREATQLTIYKSEDLTLVRESRELTFREGLNQIQFSWANTLIDPTSMQVEVKERPQEFRVLDASYPANSANAVIWNIDAAAGGKAVVEIRYFASGLAWRADYTAIANEDETLLRIEPDFTITNGSGEDFTNARTRLVVGEVHLVEAIALLARMGLIPGDKRDSGWFGGAKEEIVPVGEADEDGDASTVLGAALEAVGGAAALTKAKEIVKAAVSEYHLYSIEGEEDLRTGWGKQLPNPRTDGVKFDVSYEYNPSKHGAATVKFYKFRNDGEHKLGGTPLPEGTWYAYSGDARGGLRFQGSCQHKYAPIGEDVELNLGPDGMVVVEERTMGLSRTNFEFDEDGNVAGYDVVEQRELEVRNARGRAVPMKVTLDFGDGDWDLSRSTDAFRRVDRGTAEWTFDAPALAGKVLGYTLVTRTGSRDRTVR